MRKNESSLEKINYYFFLNVRYVEKLVVELASLLVVDYVEYFDGDFDALVAIPAAGRVVAFVDGAERAAAQLLAQYELVLLYQIEHGGHVRLGVAVGRQSLLFIVVAAMTVVATGEELLLFVQIELRTPLLQPHEHQREQKRAHHRQYGEYGHKCEQVSSGISIFEKYRKFRNNKNKVYF